LPPAVDPLRGRVTLLPSPPGIVVVPSVLKAGANDNPRPEVEVGVTPVAPAPPPGVPAPGEAIGVLLTLTVNAPIASPGER
jgi:hypothetical protein